MPTTLPARRPVITESDAVSDWMVILGNTALLVVLLVEVIGMVQASPSLLSGADYLAMMAGP